MFFFMFLKLVYSLGFLKLALTGSYLQKANPKAFQPNFFKKPCQKFESGCLIMPPTMVGRREKVNCAQMT